MSDLKYQDGTTDLKPFLHHNEFRIKYPMTTISEMAFRETQEFNYATAYGERYIGCLVAGNIAVKEIDKLEQQLYTLKKQNEVMKDGLRWYSDRIFMKSSPQVPYWDIGLMATNILNKCEELGNG